MYNQKTFFQKIKKIAFSPDHPFSKFQIFCFLVTNPFIIRTNPPLQGMELEFLSFQFFINTRNTFTGKKNFQMEKLLSKISLLRSFLTYAFLALVFFSTILFYTEKDWSGETASHYASIPQALFRNTFFLSNFVIFTHGFKGFP